MHSITDISIERVLYFHRIAESYAAEHGLSSHSIKCDFTIRRITVYGEHYRVLAVIEGVA